MNKKSTRRSFGRRALAFGVAMFAMVTLTAVGFAAWLISSDSSASGSGAINTEVVNYANVTLKINNLNTSNELADDGGNVYHIYFAPPATDSVTNSTGLVTYTEDSDKAENLEFKFSGTIGNLAQIKNLSFSLKLPDEIIKAAGYTFDGEAWSFAGAENAYIELPSYAVDSKGKALPKVVDGVKSGETAAVVFTNAELTALTDSGITRDGVKITKNGNDGAFEGTWAFKWGKRYNNANPASTFNKPNFDTTAGVESNQVYTRNQVFCELLKLQAAVNGLTLSDYYPEGLQTALTSTTLDEYVKSDDVTTVGNYLNGIQDGLEAAINTKKANPNTKLVYTLFIQASAN